MKKPRELQSELLNKIGPGEGVVADRCSYTSPVSYRAPKLFYCTYKDKCSSQTNLYSKTYCERELCRRIDYA